MTEMIDHKHPCWEAMKEASNVEHKSTIHHFEREDDGAVKTVLYADLPQTGYVRAERELITS